MDTLELIEWIIEHKTCICGGEIEKTEDGVWVCKKCGLRIRGGGK